MTSVAEKKAKPKGAKRARRSRAEILEKARLARKRKAKKKPRGDRAISATEAYSYTQLEEWFGIGPSTRRRMERNGLAVSKQGSRKFVLGSDLIEFMAKNRN